MSFLKSILVKYSRLFAKIEPKLDVIKYYQDDIKHLKSQKDKINSVVWTESQQKEFDDFWKTNYGETIPSGGSKLFEYISGNYNSRYIPGYFYRVAVEPFFNPYNESFIYEYKGNYEFLFGGIDGVRFPKTIVSCMNRYYRIGNDVVSKKDVLQICRNIGETIIKPSKWSGAGRNVSCINIIDGVDTITGKSLEEILSYYNNDFVIQERIINSDTMRKLSPNALSTFRVTSYLFNGEVYVCPIGMRMGVNDSVVDNLCAGGIVVGVHDNGVLYEKAHTYSQTGYVSYEKHPVSGIAFSNYYIGEVSKLIEAAKSLHSHITSIGIVSWDLTFDDNNEVVMIEANLLNQGTDFSQFATGEGMFRENTAGILATLPKKKFNKARI